MTVILARYYVTMWEKYEEKSKLRVVSYCCVFVGREKQVTSYEAQVEHSAEYIWKNIDGNWTGYLRMKVFLELTPATTGNLATLLRNAWRENQYGHYQVHE